MNSWLPGFIALLSFVLVINLPLGYLREGCVRFSWRWFVYVHLSIPLIIVLRLWLGYGWKLIPLTVGCAVAGQVIGGRLYRRRRP